VKAQDPRMPHLGVDGHSEDCTRPGNTVRNDHGGDLLGVELDGRVGLKQSTVPSGRSVCQRQLYAELEAARILGPRALHDRYPGVAVRFEQPRAVAVGPDGRARRHAHLWRLARLSGRPKPRPASTSARVSGDRANASASQRSSRALAPWSSCCWSSWEKRFSGRPRLLHALRLRHSASRSQAALPLSRTATQSKDTCAPRPQR